MAIAGTRRGEGDPNKWDVLKEVFGVFGCHFHRAAGNEGGNNSLRSRCGQKRRLLDIIEENVVGDDLKYFDDSIQAMYNWLLSFPFGLQLKS